MTPHPRIGLGSDIHRLIPASNGRRLWLAGVPVSDTLAADAHSDGDVVLHALVDALLGAIGRGDIGEWFPNTDPRWRGAASHVFVESAVAAMTTAGYTVGNVDVMISAERPRLADFKPAMTAEIARLLSIAPSAVNIKAGTNEGVDAVGRGEAIAAQVVVLLLPAAR